MQTAECSHSSYLMSFHLKSVKPHTGPLLWWNYGGCTVCEEQQPSLPTTTRASVNPSSTSSSSSCLSCLPTSRRGDDGMHDLSYLASSKQSCILPPHHWYKWSNIWKNSWKATEQMLLVSLWFGSNSALVLKKEKRGCPPIFMYLYSWVRLVSILADSVLF